MANRKTFTKEALIDKKERLLKELKYYEMRIEDAKSKQPAVFTYEDSSDSEAELTIPPGPSLTELKQQKTELKIRVQATKELTGIEVLKSEVNIKEPVLEREPPVEEEGVWKERYMMCRMDLVTFAMIYFTHHARGQFGAIQYCGVQVKLNKQAQEDELNNSVLLEVKTPSDAIEVLRSYAEAYRSRRTVLARLVKKYGDVLYMQPIEGGGFSLKCGNLLEISWMLQNKRSYLAPFQHKMNFDLEYIDESYIKQIKHVHQQLSDPSIDTDERTLLLDEIIQICLKAEKEMSKNGDESNTNAHTQQETQINDDNLMAPPKTVPKKSKAGKRRSNDAIACASKMPRVDKENDANMDNNMQNLLAKKAKNSKTEQASNSKNRKDKGQNVRASATESNLDSISEKRGNTKSAGPKIDKKELKSNENNKDADGITNNDPKNKKIAVDDGSTKRTSGTKNVKINLKSNDNENTEDKTNSKSKNKRSETDNGKSKNTKVPNSKSNSLKQKIDEPNKINTQTDITNTENDKHEVSNNQQTRRKLYNVEPANKSTKIRLSKVSVTKMNEHNITQKANIENVKKIIEINKKDLVGTDAQKDEISNNNTKTNEINANAAKAKEIKYDNKANTNKIINKVAKSDSNLKPNKQIVNDNPENTNKVAASDNNLKPNNKISNDNPKIVHKIAESDNNIKPNNKITNDNPKITNKDNNLKQNNQIVNDKPKIIKEVPKSDINLKSNNQIINNNPKPATDEENKKENNANAKADTIKNINLNETYVKSVDGESENNQKFDKYQNLKNKLKRVGSLLPVRKASLVKNTVKTLEKLENKNKPKETLQHRFSSKTVVANSKKTSVASKLPRYNFGKK